LNQDSIHDAGGDHGERLKAGILLLDAPGTIVATFLEGETMLAAKSGDVFYQLEVTVFAKASTVLTRAAAHVRENLHHVAPR
jgi:hypothetical protein